MWTRPSWCTPMSTNAPKLVTLVTMPGQIDAGLQILELVNVGAERERHEAVARIAPGLLQLADQIVIGEGADLVLEPAGLLHQLDARAQQRGGVDPQLRRQLVERAVALRVNAGVVERVGRVGDAQEAGRLLVDLLREPRHLQQAVARSEQPRLRPVLDDRARQAGADPRHVRQQVVRGGVHVDAHLVHARIDHRLEAAPQAGLGDIVLVLPDADALRIDLHQLGQRVLQAARDRDRAADGDVQLGELLARGVAGAVDAGPRLADHHHRHVEREVAQRLAHEGLGLAPGGAVADGDGGDAPLLHQVGQDRRGGGLPRGRLQVHEPRPEVAPGGVDHRQLAAGAQPRIDAQHRLRSERRRQQQLADILGEHGDGGGVSHLAQRLVHLGVDRHRHVNAQRQPRRALEQRRARERRRRWPASCGSRTPRAARPSTDRWCRPRRGVRPASAPAPPPSTRAASPGSGASWPA